MSRSRIRRIARSPALQKPARESEAFAVACGLGVLLALLTALIGHLCGSSAVAGCGVLAAIAIGVFYAYWRIIVSLAVLLLVLYLVAG